MKASLFELLYGRRPRLLPPIDERLPPPMYIDQHAQNFTRPRVKKCFELQYTKIKTSQSVTQSPSGEMHRYFLLLQESLKFQRITMKSYITVVLKHQEATAPGDADHLEEPTDMADQSVSKTLRDAERTTEFSRELTEWDKLHVYKLVENNNVRGEDAKFIGSYVV